jgi:glycogen debranching enzyme
MGLLSEEGMSGEAEWSQVLEGSTFMLSDPRGDVLEGSIAGLFHEDTRYLSRFALTVGGVRPALLSSGSPNYYSAAFYMTNPELPGIPEHSLSIQRFRSVGGGLTEVVVVHNHLNETVEPEVRLGVGADFADLFEVKGARFTRKGELRRSVDAEFTSILYEYDAEPFSVATRLHSTERADIEGDDLVFRLRVPARGTWKTRIQVAVRRGDQTLEPLSEEERAASRALMAWHQGSPVLERWREQVPTLSSGLELLGQVYRTSVSDLAALRLHATVEGNDFSLPAAGLPWFMAIFGRDTLITSYQSLFVGPDLARGALQALAALQGIEVNEFKDEAPGKILHEIRYGELTELGLTPHRPYYGTADATPLFLVLLSEYWRLTGDDTTCRELWPNAVRALEWIDRHGDADGDGYVEYATLSSEGLENQGWKDSWNGVLFEDGAVAKPPTALCEVQGYCYDAKVRMADVAESVMGDPELAARLRTEAADLATRFNRDFWVERRGGYYAIALDRDKRPVDSMTSNMGHLLWSGIVPEDRAGIVAKQLLSTAMFSGWGVRTLSEDDVGYNPITYHNGTVWPHDNSLVSAGLARYGLRKQANRIAMGLFQAAGHTGFRLPEVFAGYARSESAFPVRYPTASSPQAWAAAAPFLWLRLMLGLDVAGGTLTADPQVPKECGRIELRGVHALGRRFDVVAEGTQSEVTPAE